MAIEECPHCIRKVIFDNEGKCPACGQSKYIDPGKSRDKIVYEKEKKESLEKISFYNKRAPRLIIGGIVLNLIIILILILLIINGAFIIYWSGGVLIGFSVIGKGLIDLREKKELIYQFEKKYKEKLPNC